jgi:hypothetical protein
MAVTISGSSVTFSDGSAQTNLYSGTSISVDTNTSYAATSYNIGHLMLLSTWGAPTTTNQFDGAISGYAILNSSSFNQLRPTFPGYSHVAVGPYISTDPTYAQYAYIQPGSVSYNDAPPGGPFGAIISLPNTVGLDGTWRSRGMACVKGFNQGFLQAILIERVA